MSFRTEAHRFASFVVLKAPDTPSVLLETGFLSNAEDAEFLASKEGQQKIARGVRDAVQLHFARRLASGRSEEHTSELQSIMRSSYAVFCWKKKIRHTTINT